ncbi:putative Regulator of Vps4 activity in the MVB pathway-domain-containing protein [Seiridium unicorne]|uniref:Regulator of Vps4 activity in the MVB pathway-domain-containing protein n=1 Tax=Seiridium unicorne TaxID=138068 RepID=A0ABR2UHN4_9PEZI
MPPSATLATKIKVQLKLSIARLRMVQQRDEALSKTHRRAMAQLLEVGKIDSAKIRVENIIRSDITIELYEILELYCELLLARAGLLDSPTCDPGLEEAVKSIIYAAPKTEIKELQQVRALLADKFGKEFALAAIENSDGKVSEKVVKKLSVTPPKEELVQGYLEEIARAYGVDWPKRPKDLGDPPTFIDDDDDSPSGGQAQKILEPELPADSKAAQEREDLSRATPPRNLDNPFHIAPSSPSSENPRPKVTLNHMELKPSKRMQDAGIAKKKEDSSDGPGVPQTRVRATPTDSQYNTTIIMDPSHNLRALDLKDLDKIRLSELEDRVDQNIGSVISKQQVLNTYLGWLREQLVQDVSVQQGSLVEIWAKSLRDRGFNKDNIYDSFKAWQRREALNDPSTRRRFSIVEQELNGLFNVQLPRNNSRFHGYEGLDALNQKENQQPSSKLQSEKGKNKKKRNVSKTDEAKPSDYRVGKQRTGANEIPVTKRRTQGPPTASEEVIVIELDSPTKPRRHPSTVGSVTPAVVRTPKRARSPCDPDELVITRETILLDTPPEKMQPRRLVEDTPNSRADYKGDYISAVRAGVLDDVPPGKDFDVPPSPSYRCNFCQRAGEHFATLCPRNDQEWSLTQQRKNAGPLDAVKRSRDLQRSPLTGGDSYRPKDALRSHHDRADTFRPRYRDGRSHSPRRQGRRDVEEPVPSSPYRERDDRMSWPDRARHDALRQPEGYTSTSHQPQRKMRALCRRHPGRYEDSEGRLFYEEDDDVFITITETPPALAARVTPRPPRITLSEETPRTRPRVVPIVSHRPHTGVSKPYHCQKAAAEADDFLHSLREQIRNDSIEATCISEMNTILDQVCRNEDPLLFQDDNGTLCKKVTSPPFCDEVVRLFANRANPIVHRPSERRLAAEFWDDAGD